MVYTSYLKQRILYHYLRGNRAPTIARLLKEESLNASRVGIAFFLKKFEETRCITRTPGSGRPSKATAEIKAIVEQRMREDDETTAYQLYQLLIARGYSITLRTVLRCRTSLGWIRSLIGAFSCVCMARRSMIVLEMAPSTRRVVFTATRCDH